MELVGHKKINILKEDVACTFRTCRKVNPSKQHQGRRHADIPYMRKFKGKIAKFVRSGITGDEERPYHCCCGKEYHNTRSLADHLTNSCGSFQKEMQMLPKDGTVDMKNVTLESTSSSSSEDSKNSSSEQIDNTPSTSALLTRIIELERRVNYLEMNPSSCQRCMYVETNQNHYENRNMDGSYGYDPFNYNNNEYDKNYNQQEVSYPEIQVPESPRSHGVMYNYRSPPAFPQIDQLPSISDLFPNIPQKNESSS